MRRFSIGLAAALFATMTGCSFATQGEDDALWAPPSAASGPLHARLGVAEIDGADQLGFDVNRPAYVSVFEIVPGRGVSVLYPADGDQAREQTAGHFARLYDVAGRALYEPDLLHLTVVAPIYRFLIASDRPLRIARFVDSPDALRSTLGIATFASEDPYRVMDRLMELVLPDEPDDEWSTDIDIIWPYGGPYRSGASLASNDEAYELVQCYNSHVFLAPIGYPYQYCPGDGRRWYPGGLGFGPIIRAPRPPRTHPDSLHRRPPVDSGGHKRPHPLTPISRRHPGDPDSPAGTPGAGASQLRRLIPADPVDRHPINVPRVAGAPRTPTPIDASTMLIGRPPVTGGSGDLRSLIRLAPGQRVILPYGNPTGVAAPPSFPGIASPNSSDPRMQSPRMPAPYPSAPQTHFEAPRLPSPMPTMPQPSMPMPAAPVSAPAPPPHPTLPAADARPTPH